MARYGEHCFKSKRSSDLDQARAMLQGYPASNQDLMERFLENWRWEFGTIVVEGSLPFEQELSALLPGGQTFRGHLDLLQKYDDAATVEAVEQEGTFGDDDLPQLGDGALWVVTDFATHWYDKTNQLRWYAWIVQANFPRARVIEGRVQPFSTFGWAGEPVRFEGDLSSVGEELQGYCDLIAADDEFEANPGAACTSCFHVMACPCRDQDTLQAICGDTPEGHLRKCQFHEAQADAEKVILKGYAKELGRVEADGAVFEGRASLSLVPKSAVTLELDLAEFGLTVNDLTAGVTKAQIEKQAKGLEDGQREKFLSLFDQKLGSIRYAVYKATSKSDQPIGVERAFREARAALAQPQPEVENV
jgi:hypothetical protein